MIRLARPLPLLYCKEVAYVHRKRGGKGITDEVKEKEGELPLMLL